MEKQFWKEKFADFEKKPVIPYDRKGTGRPFLPAIETFTQPPEIAQRIARLCDNSAYRWFLIQLAAVTALVSKYAGTEDVTLGIPVSRQEKEAQNKVIVLRYRVDAGVSFRKMLLDIKAGFEEADRNRNYPITSLIRDLGLETNGQDCPLYDIGIASESFHDVRYFESAAPNMLFLYSGQDAGFQIRYNAAIYEPATIARLYEHLQVLLAGMLGDMERPFREVSLMGDDERARKLEAVQNNRRNYPLNESVPDLVCLQAARNPDRPAIECGEDLLSFGELEQAANRVAVLLTGRGVRRGDFVVLRTERTMASIVAMLGILKTGAAYIPVSSLVPPERLNYILKDSAARYVLDAANPDGVLKRATGSETAALVNDPSRQIAYMIYTSGSTGVPKGVSVTHRNVINLVYGLGEVIFAGYPSPLRLGLLSSLDFDASLQHVFGALMSGHTLVIVPEDARRDGDRIMAIYAAAGVNVSDGTPSHLRLMLEATAPLPVSLQQLVIGGEVLPKALVEEFYRKFGAPAVRITNVYGPTETCVNSTYFPIDVKALSGYESIPIGKAFPNECVFIADNFGNPLPMGVAGEICIGGEGVTEGYHNNPELTGEKFVAGAPGEPAGIVYRTGDRGVELSCGNIVYIGRRDGQVKVKGYRIELGEIEAVLRRHRLVEEAIVEVTKESDGVDTLRAKLQLKKEVSRTLFTCLDQLADGPGAGKKLYRLPNGLKIFHFNAHESNVLYKEIFEDSVYSLHGIRLKEGDVVVDAGANIGLFSLFIGLHCPSAKIYAFEPVPQIFEVLRMNSRLYELDMEVFNLGFSDNEQVCTFGFSPLLTTISGKYPDLQEERATFRKYVDGMAEKVDDAEALAEELIGFSPVECRLIPLSAFIKEKGLQRIDLLKIDAEKSEWEIIKGIEPEDWKKIRQVVIEVHDTGQQVGMIKAVLDKNGFDTVVSRDGDTLKNLDIYTLYATKEPLPEADRRDAEKPNGRQFDVWDNVEEIHADVLAFCRCELPSYMVPSSIRIVHRMPLRPNGKIDKAALGEMEGLVQQLPAGGSALSATQELLVRILRKELNSEMRDLHAEWNEWGLHSLRMMKFAARINEKLQIRLSLRDLFQYNTVGKLAHWLDQRSTPAMSRPFPRAEKKRYYPLSPAQKRLYFTQAAYPDSIAYNLPEVFECKGELAPLALEAAVRELIARHEALRTAFVLVDGVPVQKIPNGCEPAFQLERIMLASGDRREAIEKAIREFVRPFDLSQPPLLRMGLIELDRFNAVLLFDIHHIVTDAHSTGVIVSELMAIYNGKELREQELQYKDHSEWQLRKKIDQTAVREFWKEQFGDKITRLDLPYDYPRPLRNDHQGKIVRCAADSGLVEALDRLRRKNEMSTYMVLLAVTDVFLMKITNQQDIIVGSSVSGRVHADMETIVGLFANVLAIRNRVDPELDFTSFATRVKSNVLRSIANQEYPFDELVKEHNDEHVLNRNPIFDVAFYYREDVAVQQGDVFKGLEMREYKRGAGHSRLDLAILGSRKKDLLELAFNYNSHLFHEQTIGTMQELFLDIFRQVLFEPGMRLADIRAGEYSPAKSREIDIDFAF